MTQFTAFEGPDIIAQGSMDEMIAAQRAVAPRGVNLLIYNDQTGHVRDVDLREAPPPARGRPKLGVKPREVTLLPRHWDWLSAQRGGTSAALRRVIEDAMRAERGTQDPKSARDAAYRFLSSIAGDLPDYEEVLRALYAGDTNRFAALMQAWPGDIRAYALALTGIEALPETP